MQTRVNKNQAWVFKKANSRLLAQPSFMRLILNLAPFEPFQIMVTHDWLRTKIHESRQDPLRIRALRDQIANRVQDIVASTKSGLGQKSVKRLQAALNIAHEQSHGQGH
jgi:hypothetical protein